MNEEITKLKNKMSELEMSLKTERAFLRKLHLNLLDTVGKVLALKERFNELESLLNEGQGNKVDITQNINQRLADQKD